MTLTIETGAGVRDANAYCTAEFVSEYLASRGRSDENDWIGKAASEKAQFVIDATDYIEQRWGPLFRGLRQFQFYSVLSTATVVFTGLPSDSETLTIGDQVYTFATALSTSPDVPGEVLIGVDAAATATNLESAIEATAADSGTTFGVGTQANRHVTVSLSTATLTLTATAEGSSGDYTVLTGTPTNVTVGAFAGGADGGAQPLSFPRAALYDRSGVAIVGIPLKLKQATAEYAVRAASGTSLFVDPTVDASGGVVTAKRERVGPIEEATEYLAGTYASGAPISYPAADRLMQDYVKSPGTVIRA